jgi:hypothetical protein
MMAKVKLSTGKTIEIREPKVRDMRIVATFNDEVEKEINLIANLTGLTLEEIDELSLRDYSLFQAELKTFLS